MVKDEKEWIEMNRRSAMPNANEIDTEREPLTVSVPEAGKILGVGKAAAYEAARAGQIPVLRVGRFLRVPMAALRRMMESPSRAA